MHRTSEGEDSGTPLPVLLLPWFSLQAQQHHDQLTRYDHLTRLGDQYNPTLNSQLSLIWGYNSPYTLIPGLNISAQRFQIGKVFLPLLDSSDPKLQSIILTSINTFTPDNNITLINPHYPALNGALNHTGYTRIAIPVIDGGAFDVLQFGELLKAREVGMENSNGSVPETRHVMFMTRIFIDRFIPNKGNHNSN